MFLDGTRLFWKGITLVKDAFLIDRTEKREQKWKFSSDLIDIYQGEWLVIK